MRFEEMNPEQVEKAKSCETTEERMAFVKENGIELTDERLEGIAGGRLREFPKKDACPENKDGIHEWENTGRTRPGEYFGNLWPDKEQRCKHCGKIRWY
ncbi:MAG: hypothetical protein IKF78_11445 [Atopobiaceae bacterium]|nr:hypothetical protein [Atopobiaceae bacterium]